MLLILSIYGDARRYFIRDRKEKNSDKHWTKYYEKCTPFKPLAKERSLKRHGNDVF